MRRGNGPRRRQEGDHREALERLRHPHWPVVSGGGLRHRPEQAAVQGRSRPGEEADRQTPDTQRLRGDAGVELPEGHLPFYPSIVTAAQHSRRSTSRSTCSSSSWRLGSTRTTSSTRHADRQPCACAEPIDVLVPPLPRRAEQQPIGYADPEVQTWLDRAPSSPTAVYAARPVLLQVQNQVLATCRRSSSTHVRDYAMQKYVIGYDHVPFDS